MPNTLGEGMTILNGNIFWLTWQARKGFYIRLRNLLNRKANLLTLGALKDGV